MTNAAEPLPDSPNPVEIAMDMEKADPRPDSPARRLLLDQGRLIRTQIASERMGVALKALTAMAGVAAAATLGFMAWQASRTEQLVLAPFSVPPELAERGMTGEVVATRLRDALAAMQNDTLANRAPSSYADDWTRTPEIEIPQTGVSLTDVQAFLRDWLGQETRISGEVVRTPGGYAVTARAGEEPGKTFTAPRADLDEAVRQAAEAVYRMTQPDRFAGWLASEGKREEAAALYQELSIQGTRRERAWVFAEWASLEREPAASLGKAERALELDPEHPVAAVVVAQKLKELGRFEEALAAYRRSAALLKGERAEELAPWWAALYAKEHTAEAAALLGDYAGAARLNEAAGEPAPDQPPLACRNCSSYAILMAGRDLARNHDAAGARAMAERAAGIFPDYTAVMRAYPDLPTAYAARDWPRAMRAVQGIREDRVLAAIQAQSLGREPLTAMGAETFARLGRLEEARAVIGRTGPDCYPCRRAGAKIAVMSGDHRGADAAFAGAVRLGPSLPFAYSEWGEAKLARGDVNGAIRLFREAQERGPRWADPLKFEGDALARRGDHRAALRRYAMAAERAPRWGALHLAWGRSIQALGRESEARAKYEQAARLDLSAADRAEVQTRLARRP